MSPIKQNPYGAAPTYPTAGGASNPYLGQVARGIGQDAAKYYQQGMAPAIRANAIAAGGYGGSRQGIAEGIAQGEAQRSATNAIANLYSNAYESGQGRDLQRQLQDQQLNQQANQFGANLGETQRQFNTGQQNWNKNFGETQRQFDTGQGNWNKNFGETQRQFDTGQGNWNKNFGETQRQFDTGQQNWQKTADVNNLVTASQLANQNAMLPLQQLGYLSQIGGNLQGQQQQMSDNQINDFLKYASLLTGNSGIGSSQTGSSTGKTSSNPGTLGILGSLLSAFGG